MTVPYTFGTATTSIPLSNLDANFNTPITLGNTSIYLGNTTTTIGNLTLTNATISSGSIANITITNVSVTSANITTLTSSSITDTGLTSGRVTIAGTGGLLTDSANLTFSGTQLNVTGLISTSLGATLTNAFNINTTSAGFGSVITYQNGGVTKYTEGLNVFTGTGEWGVYDNTAALIRLYLSSTGNVGIGNSNPTGKLEVTSAAATENALKLTGSTTAATYLQMITTGGVFATGLDNSAGTTFGGTAYSGNLYMSGAYPMLFWTSGTERMRIDSIGNLGIGTAVTANYRLNIKGAGTSGDSSVYAQFTTLDTGATSGDGMLIGVGVGSSPSANIIQFENAPLLFYTNGTERMRINPSAPILCLSGGNTTTTGAGIAFPSTQSASSDVNTLDDYEEGTWTPNQGTGLTAIGTFSSVGIYTKVGRQVTVYGYVSATTSIALAGAGQLCSNLPFTEGDPPYAVATLLNSDNIVGGAFVLAAQITGSSTMPAAGNIKFSATYFV